jgi:hypothetical protein
MTSNYVLYDLAQHSSWPAQIVKIGERERWMAAQSGPLLIVARKESNSPLDKIEASHAGRKLDLGEWWRGLLIQQAEAR